MISRATYRFFRQLLLVAVALCFGASGVSASYHVCPEDKPAAPMEAMGEMEDCASMNMPASEKPVKEKKCCVDFSCPKCFSTPLVSARHEALPLASLPAALARPGEYQITYHMPDAPERPPKA